MPRWFPLRVVRRVVEFVGGGATDVDFVDSVDISDSLSGTLGPVNAEDSIDLSDSLDIDSFNAQDSVDMSDILDEITGLDVDDSVDISDQLSGTLGPVNAEDSIDLNDVLDIDNALVQESIDVLDAPDGDWTITATQPDSVDLRDNISNITTLEDDSLAIGDALDIDALTAPDSLDASDALAMIRLDPQDSVEISDMVAAAITGPNFPESISLDDQFGLVTQITSEVLKLADSFGGVGALVVLESVDLSDQIVTATLSVLHADSLAVGDAVAAADADVPDALSVSDNRSDVSFSGTLWPNAQVSNSGWSNPANMTDTNTSTAANCTATSSGTLGTGLTQNTTACNLQVSCGNPDLSDWTIDEVVLEWSITAAVTGTQVTAGQCNVNYDYSLNDGGSWTTFFAQTALNNSTSSLSLGSSTQDTYSFSGSEVSWVVPAGVTSVTVDMAGAEGGTESDGLGNTGGLGERVQATLTVTPGETIYIGVGGVGGNGGTTPAVGAGGFYGGASGGDATNAGSFDGSGGGGQSYIKRGGTADSNRVLVAGGGGGAAANLSGVGDGTAGGIGGLLTEATAASAATAGASTAANAGGGGGGGWVGGAGGAVNGGGAGGRGMAHSTQTSGASSTAGFRTGNGYVSLTYGATPISEAQIQQLRFRGVGNVLSGTGVLPVSTTANWWYTRAVITASKSYA